MFTNRISFVEEFKEFFRVDNVICSFGILVENYSNEDEFNKKLWKKFGVFFEQSGIHRDAVNNMPIKKDYDHYYDEDHPDSKYCRFNCEINLHVLYDYIKDVLGITSTVSEVYRLEAKKGDGLYSTRFAGRYVEGSHPGPMEDNSFQGIFCSKTIGNEFSRKWFFGFKLLDDVKNWVGDNYDLIKGDVVVKKYLVEEDYLIHGNKQSIFQKQHILGCEIINWNEVYSDGAVLKI